MAERSKRFQSAVLLLALALLIFLFTAIALSFLPQDLSDLEGRNEDGTSSPATRNLERVLENAASQGIKVTLTEEEINQWLAHKVEGTQEGVLGGSVSYRGTWVRLLDGSAQIVFEREAFNRLHTIAMNVEIEQFVEGNNQMNTQIHRRGGRLGQMPVPQGYLVFVMSSYDSLMKALAPEVNSLKSVLQGKATVEFEEGKVTFNPRSTNDSLDLQGF